LPAASDAKLSTWIKGLLARFRHGGPGPLGPKGERLAAEYLMGLGFEIVERNFRVRRGEADLVVTKGNLVVVVEVKTRASSRFGSPAQAVTHVKSERVYRAGCAYCRSRGITLSRLRCDVVTVDVSEEGAEPQIRHYPGAIAAPFGAGRR
jgi:putative endonuclease